MAAMFFTSSVIATAVVLTILPVKSGDIDSPDYHFVPFAGDVFGA